MNKKQKPKYKVKDVTFIMEMGNGTSKSTMTFNLSPSKLLSFETISGIYPKEEYLTMEAKIERLEANADNLRLEMEKSYGYRVKKFIRRFI